MLRAKVRIESGGKVYEIGQSVTGLSKTDKEWLAERGYVDEVKPETKAKGDEENEDGKK